MENNENNGSIKEDVLSIKSIDEKENNDYIINIIEKSNNNNITFISSNTSSKINIKSIKKIFSLITEKEKLSDMYLDHITINILDFNSNENKENQNLELNSNNADDEPIELDIKYKTILDKATIFHINLEKNVENNKEESDIAKLNTNIKRTISRRSLTKIFSYLKQSIISMSDYINLIILYLNNENQNDLAKLVIEQKILGKYSKSIQKIHFDGKKNFNCFMDIPLKNMSQNIYTMDMLFNKVLDYIDDYDKESSFSDNINNLIIPRKKIDDDLIQTAKVCFIEEGILTDSNTNNNTNTNTKKGEIIHSSNQNICGNSTCNEVCYIF